MKRKFAAQKAAGKPSFYPVAGHIADAGKMVDQHSIISAAVDPSPATGYRNKHIRPVAVRPLDHPERWPTPRGFLFVAPKRRGPLPNVGAQR